MSTSNATTTWRRRATLALLLGAAGWAAAAPASLIGRTVETRDGEELGKVRDLAVDLDSGRITYVVVSVGSFLIDDSLIAVAPDALRHSADRDGRLILEAGHDALRQAPRFSSARWPEAAQVLASPQPADDVAAQPTGDDASAAGRGTATISDGNRTATLADGASSIEFSGEPPAPAGETVAEPAAAPEAGPLTPFQRLDRDGDGLLNRAEIAHELTRTDSYGDIDLDASGSIDEGEFERLLQQRGSDG